VVVLKTAATVGFTILCLLISTVALALAVQPVRGQSATIYVDYANTAGPWNGTQDFPYENITSALRGASDGNTILVHKGVYSEDVVINKSVSLIGEGVENTIINGSSSGNVVLILANSITLEGFTIRNSGINPETGDSGVRIQNSIDNVVRGDTIISNYDGVGIYYSSSNVVSGNSILNNRNYGVNLYSSGNNVVSANSILNNSYGVFLFYSSNNVVSANSIVNNYFGIAPLSFCYNNTVFHNNFSNTIQVQTYSTNVWDYGGEGNYWSDYLTKYPNATEIDGTGMGDISYVIDVNNTDKDPLMGAFSDFTVIYEGESYHVTVISNSTVSAFRFLIGAETGNKILSFNATSKDDAVSFCRVSIPTKLMNYYPYITLAGNEEIVPTLLHGFDATDVYLYLTCSNSNQPIIIISSETQSELTALESLNSTYYQLSSNYTLLGKSYSQLQKVFAELNASYQSLLTLFNILSVNYTRLQGNYIDLNASYQRHLSNYSESAYNLQNLLYIFAATTAIFIITIIYLSKRVHAVIPLESRAFKEKG
jgi:parallel beta-helix repeat protein